MREQPYSQRGKMLNMTSAIPRPVDIEARDLKAATRRAEKATEKRLSRRARTLQATIWDRVGRRRFGGMKLMDSDVLVSVDTIVAGLRGLATPLRKPSVRNQRSKLRLSRSGGGLLNWPNVRRVVEQARVDVLHGLTARQAVMRGLIALGLRPKSVQVFLSYGRIPVPVGFRLYRDLVVQHRAERAWRECMIGNTRVIITAPFPEDEFPEKAASRVRIVRTPAEVRFEERREKAATETPEQRLVTSAFLSQLARARAGVGRRSTSVRRSVFVPDP